MSTLKLVETVLNTIYQLNKATSADIIVHCNPSSSDHEKQLKKALSNAQYNGLVESEKVNGQRTNKWMLTRLGRDRIQGKEITLSHPPEKITQTDVDKTIQQFSNQNSQPTPVVKHGAIPIKEDFGANFNTDGKLIIWNGKDEVIFTPPQAANIIAFIANQMPWVEYCKQHGSVK